MGKKGPGPGIWEEPIRYFVLGCRALPANAITQIFCLWTYSSMSWGGNVSATGARTKKGRNFNPEEEEQCCRSFMHTSTDARRGIGQKNAAFWSQVALHYVRYKPDGGADRPTRSLETKWSDIKCDVAKFTGCYVSVKDLQESGKTEDDIVLDAMNLYKQKVGKAFVLKHCWLLLKKLS